MVAHVCSAPRSGLQRRRGRVRSAGRAAGWRQAAAAASPPDPAPHLELCGRCWMRLGLNCVGRACHKRGRGGVSESGRRGMVRPGRATGLTLPARARGAAAREAPAIVAALQEAAGVIAAGARVLAKRPGVQGSVGRGRGQARWAPLAAQPPVYVVTVCSCAPRQAEQRLLPLGQLQLPSMPRPAIGLQRAAAGGAAAPPPPARVAQVAAPAGAAAPSTSPSQRARSRQSFRGQPHRLSNWLRRHGARRRGGVVAERSSAGTAG